MRVNYETESHEAITATTNFDSQQLEHMYGYSVQFIWTSTNADATLLLQASNNGTDWDNISYATQAILNDDSSKLFVVPEAMYRYVRARVEVSGGSIDTLEIATYIKGT